MKQRILLILVAAFACLSASAQKGMKGVGVEAGAYFNNLCDVFPEINVGGSIVFQYNCSNYYRIQPFVAYNCLSEGDEYQVGIDNHILFGAPRKIRPYFSLGVAYGSVPEFTGTGRVYHYDDFSGKSYYDNQYSVWETKSCFVGRFGLGLDIRLSHNITAAFEAMGTLYAGKDGWSEHWGPVRLAGGLQIKARLCYNF